jgi:hypothetical protein
MRRTFMHYRVYLSVATSLLALTGCETVQAVGAGTLNMAKGTVTNSVSANRVRVKNASSMPICAVTVGVGSGSAPTASSSSNYDDRRVDRMRPLGPGEEGLVDLGAKAPRYNLKAFSCNNTGNAGAVLADVSDVQAGHGTISLH